MALLTRPILRYSPFSIGRRDTVLLGEENVVFVTRKTGLAASDMSAHCGESAKRAKWAIRSMTTRSTAALELSPPHRQIVTRNQ